MNGMVFKESFNSGTAQTIAVDVTGEASFSPYARELSNVNITGEFTKMMMVQSAYNSNATVFKTVDEMVMVARDLKT
jgi:flagellar hook protein FlgE